MRGKAQIMCNIGEVAGGATTVRGKVLEYIIEGTESYQVDLSGAAYACGSGGGCNCSCGRHGAISARRDEL